MPNTHRDYQGKLVPKYFNTYSGITLKSYWGKYTKLKGKVPKEHLVDNLIDYRKIIDKIFKLAKEDILEKRDGVVLDKLGYICNWATPEPKAYRDPKTGKLHTNLFTGGKFYTMELFTWVFRGNKLRGWYMENAFAARLNRAMYYKLKEGMRYGMQLKLVRAIFGGEINYKQRVKKRFRK